MSIERRIEALEAQFGPPEDEVAEQHWATMRDILDEMSRLKACRAPNSYRGGSPPTPIQPTDPAGEHLGYPYTWGQLVGYAVRHVFEREGDETPDVLSREATEELITSWTEDMRKDPGFEEWWEELDAEGPPGRTRPWH